MHSFIFGLRWWNYVNHFEGKNYHIKYRQRSRTRKSRPKFTKWRFGTAVWVCVCVRFLLNITSVWHWKHTTFSFIHDFSWSRLYWKKNKKNHMHMEDSLQLNWAHKLCFQLDIEVFSLAFICYSCFFLPFELLESGSVTFLNVNLINNERRKSRTI